MKSYKEFKHGDLVYEVSAATKIALLVKLKRNIFYKEERDNKLMGKFAWYYPSGEPDREAKDCAIYHASEDVKKALTILLGESRVYSEVPD